MKMVFFAKDEEQAKRHIKRATHDYYIDTGRQLKEATPRLAKRQMKHSSGWKTWEW